MSKKIILCVVLLLVSSLAPSSAKKKKTVRKAAPKTEQRYEEIDNYDFLYTGEQYDYQDNYAEIDNLMDEAFKHIGARYRSGAKGPSAFDCSGFTSYVYSKMMNKSIGASSRDQYAKNTPIRKDELQTGDLVFFTSPHSGKSVGHVGIVVDVNPETGTFDFIHASSKSGVKVSNSSDGYYSRRYVGARRVN